ncbi:MAG: glutamate-5-semialdehyde dehydrogenase [Firmicutes bacterium]|nr:glutamate-5-semialdehyde dehydrogenase [Bacillota bacterium]
MTVREQVALARQAALALASSPDETRTGVLLLAATALEKGIQNVLAANALDMAAAEAEGLPQPLRKRLRMDEKKVADLCEGLRSLAQIGDPLHRTQLATELAPGLSLYRVTCPIGVIGVIFESRPDALVQIASLCLRSGNAVLLKGGREALQTNRALFRILDTAVRQAGLPDRWAVLLETREDVGEMLALAGLIDLIIPRGSNEFVRFIMDHSRIPVLGHAEGKCHVYVDCDADVDMAVKITVDSKTQYVAVCNAAETLLVHRAIAGKALPAIADALRSAGVALRGCERTRAITPCEPATEEDFDTEYLDYILSIKVVDSLAEAIGHINAHGSGHTDVIVTRDERAARTFLREVDSAGVFWNCSTRFSDGFRYGFGAEVGVATGKLHARGPMGIEGLCTYKYKLIGHGHTVGEGLRYTHKPLDNACPLEEEAEAPLAGDGLC